MRPLFVFKLLLFATTVSAQSGNKMDKVVNKSRGFTKLKQIYADTIIKVSLGNKSKYSFFYGAQIKNKDEQPIIKVNPRNILGNNTHYCLCLPEGSELIVGFKDKQIINFPNRPDLFIQEYYPNQKEKAIVYVSHDGINFDSLGIAVGGKINKLDLDSIGFKQSVRFVKIISLNSNGGLPGFDLVSIHGLGKAYKSSKNKTKVIAKKPIIQKIKQKKEVIIKNNFFIMKSVNFDLRSAKLKSAAQVYLNKLAIELKNIIGKKLKLLATQTIKVPMKKTRFYP
jgi:hypothetical protein